MDLKETTDLISLRSYVALAVNNFALDRETVRYYDGLLIMIDRKIAELLKDGDFKNYVGYEGVREAIQEVRRNTDIKSSLKK
jgi:hypothetical protein